MPLNLYLDDCANSNLLADLLRQAGHTVTRPARGWPRRGGRCFAFAAMHHLTVITKNAGDFLVLHRTNPHHSGILAVYSTRTMTDAEIVRAIKNLENAISSGGDPIPGMFHSLNDWRY